MASRWIPKTRNFEEEVKKGKLEGKATEDHPLQDKPIISIPVQKLTSGVRASVKVNDPLTGGDPLTKGVANPLSGGDPLTRGVANPLSGGDPLTKGVPNPLSGGFVDPLGLASPKPVVRAPVSPKESESTTPLPNSTETPAQPQPQLDNFVPWKAKKSLILQEFTTNESIGITVSFIDTDSAGKARPPVDRTQQRLSELDQTPEDQAKQTLTLTQKDYEKHIEKLHEDLTNEWNNGEKVKALKIAIQCAKLLADTEVPKFYPSKFVLITEILDTFGKLVYERIGGKAEEGKTQRYIPETISAQARETCRNWFYKIASIRELLPRLYIEMAILSSYRFIQHTSFPAVINRIANQIRGIGNPLVSMYARTYLARKGYEVEPTLKTYVIQSFYDYLDATLKQDKAKMEAEIKRLRISPSEYYNLYSPALDWQLQCIGTNGTEQLLQEILDKYKQNKNPFILKNIIASFNPQLIAKNASLIVGLIKEVDDTFPKYQLYTALGVNLALSAPPKDQQLPILREVWSVVTTFTDPKEYILTADVFIEYPLKHCTPREVNGMLKDILKHVKENNVYEKFQGQLHSIVTKIVSNLHDFAVIFNMDSFLAILDLFTGDTQIEVNKSILSAFAKYQQPTSDPIIISTMFTIGKSVHDSVNSLTFFDEIRQISKTLTAFINKIEFGIDLEKHLNFYVECRRAFGNLDSVKYRLIAGACNLCMKTLKLVKGKHTKKTSAFIRACISFCFITIPTLEDVLDRLQLYLLAGQVALQNQALSQADALFKSAIKLIQEVPPKIEVESQGMKSTEDALVSFLKNFLSTLVIVPGHPEQGPFYLIKGLLKVISEYQWEPQNGAKLKVYMSVLSLLSVYYQPKFPYAVRGVESNDALYFQDEDYMKELVAIINKILEDILSEFAKMKEDANNEKALPDLALDLFNGLFSFSELNAKSATLGVQLFELIKSPVSEAYKKNSLLFVQKLEGNLASQLYSKIKDK